MRVVFLEDVPGVAQGGDVKEVKRGFARNYLIPKNLATPATHNALQRTSKLRQSAHVTRLKQLEDMRELAAEIDGTQVDVEMRAGSAGQLYGSVTNTIIARELSSITEREIERRMVDLDDPIRELGSFDLRVWLHPEVDAGISVLVYPTGSTPEQYAASLVEEEEDIDDEYDYEDEEEEEEGNDESDSD